METKNKKLRAKLDSLNDLAKEVGLPHLKVIGLVGVNRTVKCNPHSDTNFLVGDFSLSEDEEIEGTHYETFEFAYEAEVFLRQLAGKHIVAYN